MNWRKRGTQYTIKRTERKWKNRKLFACSLHAIFSAQRKKKKQRGGDENGGKRKKRRTTDATNSIVCRAFADISRGKMNGRQRQWERIQAKMKANCSENSQKNEKRHQRNIARKMSNFNIPKAFRLIFCTHVSPAPASTHKIIIWLFKRQKQRQTKRKCREHTFFLLIFFFAENCLFLFHFYFFFARDAIGAVKMENEIIPSISLAFISITVFCPVILCVRCYYCCWVSFRSLLIRELFDFLSPSAWSVRLCVCVPFSPFPLVPSIGFIWQYFNKNYCTARCCALPTKG